MRADQLTKHVIVPTLKYLGEGMYSEAAVRLLLGTAATESGLGEYITQYPTGPGSGIYQIEPQTDWDIHQNYLRYRPELLQKVQGLVGPTEMDAVHPLIGNLAYQTAIARIQYKRDPRPLPAAGDLQGLAETYKRVFNTVKGKGSVEKFLADAKRLKIFDDEA